MKRSGPCRAPGFLVLVLLLFFASHPTAWGAVPGDNAEFVADVTIPDGTMVSPGQTVTKTWRLKNTGTSSWGAGYQLVFRAGEPLGVGRPADIPLTRPGETVDVGVSLQIPTDALPGRHVGRFQLRNAGGAYFGPAIWADLVVPGSPRARVPRLVLGNYFTWYDAGGWTACNISAGDKPAQPYSSDDPQAIARHIGMARDAGLDGFTAHWFAPGDRTDRNFATLLAQSEGTGFQSTVVFLRHIWPGSPAPTQQNVAEAVRHIVDRYGGHPNFLKLDGKPVLFFADVYRVPVAKGQTPQQAWAAIRAQVDPQGRTWWIAEGLDPSYLAVFDGLYVFKITHARYPDDFLKAPLWADRVRQWENKTGRTKLWIATVSPGWDDTRAGCKRDVRVPSTPHKRNRADGQFYQATFDAALKSNPDWLWINSFNEWVEGTYVEPSAQYGDKYLQMSREFAGRFKAR